MTKLKYYTGIGSRQTPKEVCQKMKCIAKTMEREDFTLRSGGADGADSAFEAGAGSKKQIFLPSDPYKGRYADQRRQINCEILYNWEDAMDIAKFFHPNWNSLGYFVKKLMARNTYQILGLDLESPSDVVYCWTADGSVGYNTTRKTGGTGQALRIAYEWGIDIINLYNVS